MTNIVTLPNAKKKFTWTPSKNEILLKALQPFVSTCLNYDELCNSLQFSLPIDKSLIKRKVEQLFADKNAIGDGSHSKLLSLVENKYLAFTCKRSKSRTSRKSSQKSSSDFVDRYGMYFISYKFSHN